MLVLPEYGFQPSIKKHNVKLDVMVDWIEGSLAFSDEEISQTTVNGILRDNGIYREQDFANQIITDAWVELSRRAKCVNRGTPFETIGRTVRRKYEWEKNPAYSFCLLLSVRPLFKSLIGKIVTDFNVQGQLFEELTAECLVELGWSTLRTGWNPDNTVTIKEVVDEVSNHIGESPRIEELKNWVSTSAKEEGLDVVCSNPFRDDRGGRPLFFFQCASGEDWPQKLSTPDLNIWEKLISFSTNPQRGFSLPFALLDQDFKRRAGKVNGMFIDRFRLQAPSVDGNLNWTSDDLSKRIINWMRPQVEKLPN